MNAKARVLRGYQYFEQVLVLRLLGLLMVVVLYAAIGLVISVAMMMVQRLRTWELSITLPS
jgi:hypothetical protein